MKGEGEYQVNYVLTVKVCRHAYELLYRGHNLASTAVMQYYSGVGYSPSLFILIIYHTLVSS